MSNGSRLTGTIRMINNLLDAGYNQQAFSVVRSIANNSQTGRLKASLDALDAEADRLIEAGERMAPDNPVLRAVMTDFEDVMVANQVLLNSKDEAVQAVGQRVAEIAVKQTAMAGIPQQAAQQVAAEWLRPSPGAVAELVNYTSSPEWIGKLDRYGRGVPKIVNGMAQRGIISGWNPRRVAREVRRSTNQLPASYANTMMRTLMNTSYRDASAAQRAANGHIVEYHVRIATLDDRTCMACIALDGKVLRNEERVHDHHNGRCTSVPKVRGVALPAWEPAQKWFDSQPVEQQERQMGKAQYAAFRDGAIRWDDMHQPYDDDTFGPMVAQASLKGMLGDRAAEYKQ